MITQEIEIENLDEEDVPTTTMDMSTSCVPCVLSEEAEKFLKKKNEAMKNVFDIQMVVERVIEFVNVNDLKTCRHVCSTWKKLTTKVILKQDCFQVKISYNYYKQKFQRFVIRLPRQKINYLIELIQLIENSSQFPCSTFTISEGSLDNPEMMDFFKTGGKEIKTLNLIVNSQMTLTYFREILKTYCPNVETLHLNRFNYDWDNVLPFSLSKLKVLSMEGYGGWDYKIQGVLVSPFRILRSIIATELEVIKGFVLGRDYDEILKAKKIHAVKELFVADTGPNSLPHTLQAFVNGGGPQLEVLIFWCSQKSDEDWRTKFAVPLQQVFDACKDTLKIFSFSGLGHMFKGLQLPQFSNLKEIRVNDPWNVPVRLFPIQTDLTETFPTLDIFDITQTTLNDATWDQYFPSDAFQGELSSVTSVIANETCTDNCKNMLQLICPKASMVVRPRRSDNICLR